jgi:hypothetical protein
LISLSLLSNGIFSSNSTRGCFGSPKFSNNLSIPSYNFLISGSSGYYSKALRD